MFQNTEIYEKIYEEARRNDEKIVSEIEEFKKELEGAQQCLKLNKKHLFQHAMIPLANGKALVKGRLVHTNEIFAYIGDNWFIKTSADRAIEICDRRIQRCNENLKQLETEMTRFDSNLEKSREYEIFPNEDVKEITEPYDEEKEKEWRRQHKENVRKYKEKERTERDTKPDIFEKLNQLEKEEANSSKNDPALHFSLENRSDKVFSSEKSFEYSDQFSVKESVTVKPNLKKHVSFSDLEENDGYVPRELLVTEDTNIIRFKHSASNTQVMRNEGLIESPSIVYPDLLQNSRPKSTLKKEISHLAGDKEQDTKVIYENMIADENRDEVLQIRDNLLRNERDSSLLQVFGDITERASDVPCNKDKATRPVSQFKKSRMKNIRGLDS